MNQELNSTNEDQAFSRFAIPIRYGLMAGFVVMFLTTINFLYLLNTGYIFFMLGGFLMFVSPIVFYFLVAKRQRDIMGGSITLKDTFQAIFIVIILSSSISAIYGLIYNNFIDPDFVTRMKRIMEEFFVRSKMPQEKIDEVLANVDSATSGAKDVSRTLYGFAQGIIMQSLIGFIVALVMKREKKITG